MTVADLRAMCNLFRERNIPVPFSIEIDMASFKTLKTEAATVSHFATILLDAPANKIRLFGVNIIGKQCTCGAHPEDNDL